MSRSLLVGALSERIGYWFKAESLLEQALTHPSILVKKEDKTPNAYERLEFLGDRVLGLVIAHMIYQRFPRDKEGDLSRRHTALVRRETLAYVAENIQLERYLLTTEEEPSKALLADGCEALIGAMYLDGGLEAVYNFIERFWTPIMEAAILPPKDAKSTLQEWAQARGMMPPVYHLITMEGLAHAPQFVIEVTLENKACAQGKGASKRLAEQTAATTLLHHLEKSMP